ncbi:hypothetical protein CFC21_093823 [Triticum aestivum]|uniref:Uncharacterized protein n=2 Tax=Triticum aestivum TaxID=4565 RepID=A0A3B6QIB9_WHEAT|nr:hypothetical protein CFC21_093823 [Triticum aestivum]
MSCLAIEQLEAEPDVLAVPDVRLDAGHVHLLLCPAPEYRRRVQARLDGRGPDARDVGHLLVPVRAEQDPRLDAGEAVGDVPEGGPGAHGDLVAVAEEVDLGQRLLVVLVGRVLLLLLVARLVHRHDLPRLGRALVVEAPDLVVVARVERRDQHGLHLPVVAGRVHRRGRRVAELRQKALLPDAPGELVVHVLELDGLLREDPDLEADLLVHPGEVRLVVAPHDPPHPVRRVEEVAAEVVEHGLPLREHPRQLLLVHGREEQRRREVAVGLEDHPAELAEQPLVVVAEDVVRQPQPGLLDVEVDVRRQRRRRRVMPDHAVLEHVDVALGRADVELHRVPLREPAGEHPGGAREGLAEEALLLARHVDEHDPAGEQRVEEGGGDGEHAVAEAVAGEPHHVLALGAVGVAPRLELLDGRPVALRARAALLVVRLVLAQLLHEVGGERERRRLPVQGRLVSALARRFLERRRE